MHTIQNGRCIYFLKSPGVQRAPFGDHVLAGKANQTCAGGNEQGGFAGDYILFQEESDSDSPILEIHSAGDDCRSRCKSTACFIGDTEGHKDY